MPIAHYAVGDAMAEAHAMVSLIGQGWAESRRAARSRVETAHAGARAPADCPLSEKTGQVWVRTLPAVAGYVLVGNAAVMSRGLKPPPPASGWRWPRAREALPKRAGETATARERVALAQSARGTPEGRGRNRHRPRAGGAGPERARYSRRARAKPPPPASGWRWPRAREVLPKRAGETATARERVALAQSARGTPEARGCLPL
jgi:hypothetical protein